MHAPASGECGWPSAPPGQTRLGCFFFSLESQTHTSKIFTSPNPSLSPFYPYALVLYFAETNVTLFHTNQYRFIIIFIILYNEIAIIGFLFVIENDICVDEKKLIN